MFQAPSAPHAARATAGILGPSAMGIPPPSETPASPGGPLPESLVRHQLETILASEIFSRSERLSTFLRFTVEQTLAGRGEMLKEQVLAVELYGRRRGPAADDDSIVRTDARRLRDKLREFYSESTHEPVIITLPKGSYTPLFAHNAAILPAVETLPVKPASGARSAHAVRLWIAGAAVVTLAAVAIASLATRTSPPPPQLVPLTQYPGGESDPSLSPDGNFVAFSWTGPVSPAAQDIWVKAVNSEALRRLTNTPAPVAEHSPAWSPDGKEIAFERVGYALPYIAGQGVFVISQLGGPERKISDSGRNPKWTPMGAPC